MGESYCVEVRGQVASRAGEQGTPHAASASGLHAARARAMCVGEARVLQSLLTHTQRQQAYMAVSWPMALDTSATQENTHLHVSASNRGLVKMSLLRMLRRKPLHVKTLLLKVLHLISDSDCMQLCFVRKGTESFSSAGASLLGICIYS